MFGKQSMRLLRESWPNVDELAEELYAMFQDDIPLEHNAPVTITVNQGEDPPLRLRQFSDGPQMVFEGPQGTVGTIDAQGDLTDAQGKKKTGTGSTSGGGRTERQSFMGKVVSGGPTTYQMQLFEDNISTPIMEGGAPKVFTVKQGDTRSTLSLAPDSWTAVVKFNDGTYGMQFGVWTEVA